MQRTASKMRVWIGQNACRVLWALLIALHITILASVANTLFFNSENGSWLAFISLILTIFGFILKLIDVPFLRFHTNRSGALVFIVSCLFMHHELVASEVAKEVVQQAPMVLALGAVAKGARATRRHLCDIWRDLTVAFSPRLIIAHSNGTVVALPTSNTRWLITLLIGPRAPPV